MATYGEYVDLLDGFAQHMSKAGAYKVLDFSVGSIRMWCFMNDQLFSLIRIQDVGPNSLAFIDIAGAGARGMRPDGELFRYIAMPDERFQYGSRFVSVRRDGLVLSGARLALPLAILSRSDAECTRFVLAMVENLGLYSRQTAGELIPAYGGRLLDGDDQDDMSELFAAVSGH